MALDKERLLLRMISDFEDSRACYGHEELVKKFLDIFKILINRIETLEGEKVTDWENLSRILMGF